METKVITPRKIFPVTINDKIYYVYDIEGKKHEPQNGEPDTWWLYFSSKLPEGTIPPIDSESWVPYHCSIQRLNWNITFKQTTTTKEKWGDIHFRSSTYCEMWCNNKLVYAFPTTGGDRGMAFAMAKAQYLQTMLCEHPYNFLDAEVENGRKICWYGLPATIKVKSSTWEIGVIPDYTAEFNKDEWWAELERKEKKWTGPDENDDKEMREMDDEDRKEDKNNDYINWGDALSDQHIDWFRK